MTWVVKRTDTFLDSLRDIRKNKEALAELDKKLKRLREDPLHVGGWLSGEQAVRQFIISIPKKSQ